MWLPRGTGEPLPPAFRYLWLGTLVNRLGTFVLPFLTLFLTTRRGMEPAAATLIVALYGLGGFGASFLGGLLADRLGRRTTLIVSMLSGAALMLAVPAIDSPYGLAAVVALLGLGGELYRPAVSAVVADLVPAGNRLRAFSLLYWATNLGAGLAPVIGGLIAARSYTALFVGDAATMALYALVVRLRVPETRPADSSTARTDTGGGTGPADRGSSPPQAPRLPVAAAPPPPRRLALALRDPLLLGLAVLSFGFACLFTQAYTTLPLSMSAAGLGATLYGFAIAFNGAEVVLLSLPVAAFVERFPRLPALAAASLLAGVGVFLHLPASSAAAYAGAIAVWTLGEIVMAPLVPALIADLAPDHARGTYQGVYMSAWSLAHFAGPALGGAVLQRWGEPALWTGCLAVGLAAAAGFLALVPAARRRLARP